MQYPVTARVQTFANSLMITIWCVCVDRRVPKFLCCFDLISVTHTCHLFAYTTVMFQKNQYYMKLATNETDNDISKLRSMAIFLNY